MAVKRGAAIVQIAVTSPVVIKTTSTHPGTSPRSSLSRAKKLCWIVLSLWRRVNSAIKARSSNLLIIPLSMFVVGWRCTEWQIHSVMDVLSDGCNCYFLWFENHTAESRISCGYSTLISPEMGTFISIDMGTWDDGQNG